MPKRCAQPDIGTSVKKELVVWKQLPRRWFGEKLKRFEGSARCWVKTLVQLRRNSLCAAGLICMRLMWWPIVLSLTYVLHATQVMAKPMGWTTLTNHRGTSVELPADVFSVARGRLIAYLEKWLKDNEMISAGALDAERERSDGIARDLAAVRSELADRITAEASARNEIAQLTKRLEASENEWTTRLTAERGSNSGSLAAVRAELADSITAVASARTEIEQLIQRLAANEKDWTTKLDAERELSRGLTRDLATVRAELAERIAAEASARGGILDLEKLSKANETEWTSRFPPELERSEGMAQDLENGGEIIECSAVRGQDRGHWAWREIDGRRCWYRGEPGRAKTLLRWSKQIPPPAVSGAAAERPEIRDQAEHAKRIAAEASVLPASDFTLNSKTESVPNDRGYVRPLVEQTPIPLPRPAPRIQPQTTATNDQSPHSANTEQPTKAAAKDVRDTRDNPTREAKQRRADDHPFGSVFDSVR